MNAEEVSASAERATVPVAFKRLPALGLPVLIVGVRPPASPVDAFLPPVGVSYRCRPALFTTRRFALASERRDGNAANLAGHSLGSAPIPSAKITTGGRAEPLTETRLIDVEAGGAMFASLGRAVPWLALAALNALPPVRDFRAASVGASDAVAVEMDRVADTAEASFRLGSHTKSISLNPDSVRIIEARVRHAEGLFGLVAEEPEPEAPLSLQEALEL